MKKLLFFLLLLAPLFAIAQNYKPTTPAGSTSFTPTFRYKDSLSVDSLRRIWLSSSGKWFQISTVGLSGGGAFLPLVFTGDNTVNQGAHTVTFNALSSPDTASFLIAPNAIEGSVSGAAGESNYFYFLDSEGGIQAASASGTSNAITQSVGHTSVQLSYQKNDSTTTAFKRIQFGDSADGLVGIPVTDEQDHIGLIGKQVFPLSDSPNQYAQYGKVDSLISAAGSGSGTVTSITPGVGFLSHTPITTNGTMDVDTAGTIVSKTFAGRYITAASTDALTNKSGNISQWANDSGYITAASNVPQLIATSFGVIADGTTDNTIAIAAIETACPSAGCEIFWPAGDIKATHIDVQKPQIWIGMGGIIPTTGTRAITTFTTATTTGHFVTVSANNVKFQDVAFACTGTATAGSGIYVANSIGFRMIDCSLYHFYDQLNYRSGWDWKFDGSVFLLPKHSNLLIADTAIADAGDAAIAKCWFYSNITTSGVYQIVYNSGGGLKISDTKINGFGSTYYGGINVAINATTTDFLASNNSIENATIGINIAPTVTFSAVSINGGEIQSSFPIVADGSGGSLSGLTVVGVHLAAGSGNACITTTSCDWVTIGPNTYLTGEPTSFTSTTHLSVVRSPIPLTFSGTTPTYDLNLGNYQSITLSGATTMTLANNQAGDTWFLAVAQDATGGRTLSITGATVIGGNSLDTAPNAVSYIVGHQNIITIFSNVTGTFSSLTVTGNSGASTLVSGVLNVPTYTAAGLGAVPTTRTVAGFALSSDVSLATLTPGTHLSGSAYDGSTNRTLTTDATSTPAASVITAYDANSNLSANSFIPGYATTATAAGTTTLTVASAYSQFFTGLTTQTVTLPVTSTLVLGQQYKVVNNSSGVVTVNSSGSNVVRAMAASSSAIYTCILTSGTTAASWSVAYAPTAGGSTNIGNTDLTLSANRTLTSGGFTFTVNPATIFNYYSGSGSLSTQIHLTDLTNGHAYISGNGILRGGADNGFKLGVISAVNTEVSTTKPSIIGTATALTISSNISGTPVVVGDNNLFGINFVGKSGYACLTSNQGFLFGSGTTAPYLQLYTTGGVSVGATPSDPGVNSLYVQNAIKPASTQTSVGGSTSGTAVFSQPMQGTSYKVVIIKFAALLGTASYTFPTAFATTPSVVATDDVAAGIVTSKSTTAVTVTGATSNGSLMLIGY